LGVRCESNLNIRDDAVAREQIEKFERDKAHARRFTLDQWRARSAIDRALDDAAELVDTQR